MAEFKLGANEYSALALAYLGDCIIELCVRQRLVKQGLASSRTLNKAALEYVRAPKQAEAMKNILPLLTEEENAVIGLYFYDRKYYEGE